MNYMALSLHYCSVFLLLAVALTVLPLSTHAFVEGVEVGTRTISISGGNGVFSVDNQYILPIYLTATGLDANDAFPVNALEIELLVNPSDIRLDALYILPEHCEERFVINEVLDGEGGIAYKACGTIAPVAATSTLLLGYVHITPLVAGTSTISFGFHTTAYAHNGLGTQVIGTHQGLDLVSIE